jgi:hypothetical protein
LARDSLVCPSEIDSQFNWLPLIEEDVSARDGIFALGATTNPAVLAVSESSLFSTSSTAP